MNVLNCIVYTYCIPSVYLLYSVYTETRSVSIIRRTNFLFSGPGYSCSEIDVFRDITAKYLRGGSPLKFWKTRFRDNG